MKLLVLAPQPFYQERGTPIAVKLLLEELRHNFPNFEITLLTFHEGSSIDLPGVTHLRMTAPSFLKNVTPGASPKKFIADFFFLLSTITYTLKNRPQQIHAVEESSFIALLMKLLFKIPYFYDMDSLLSSQLIERWPNLSLVQSFFRFCESLAIKNADQVVAVCPAIAKEALSLGAKKVTILSDIALGDFQVQAHNFKESLKLPNDALISLYVGNMEHYQGIDLALESFTQVVSKNSSAVFVLVGGTPKHVEHYTQKAQALGISKQVYFTGARPVTDLPTLLLGADILISPRLKGINTPMKLYSYLAAGRAILATDLLTHTQVLDSETAQLAPPEVAAFSKAWEALITQETLRNRLGLASKLRAEEKHSRAAFSKSIQEIYS